ncbi:MAG: phosphatase PAP2 family protein [Haloechinothrix sp.]
MTNSVIAERPPSLPPQLRGPMATVAVLATLVVALLGILYSADTGPGAFDRWAQPAFDDVEAPLRYVALLIDFGGEPLGAALLVTTLVAACVLLGRGPMAVLGIAGPGLTVVATTVLKPIVGRTIHGHHLAYPSGHTALAAALALIVALLVVDLLRVGKLAGVLMIMAAAILAGAAMAWAQVALGAHYPTDTLGGFCTALAVVPAAAWLVDRATYRTGSSGAARPNGRSR